MSKTKFELIHDEETVSAPQQPAPAPHDNFSMEILLLALKALSQRAMVAFANMFTLLTVASVWLLFKSVIHHADTYQLVGLTLYAAFVIAIHLVRKR